MKKRWKLLIIALIAALLTGILPMSVMAADEAAASDLTSAEEVLQDITTADGVLSDEYLQEEKDVVYLPDVTAEMSQASYWYSKVKSPTKVLANQSMIEAVNEAILNDSETHVQDLSAWTEETYDGIALNASLKSSAESDAKYFYDMGVRYNDAGEKYASYEEAKADLFDPLIANCEDLEATETMPVKFAICTNVTNLLAYPTDHPLYDDPSDPDFNYLYLTKIRVNEPLVIKSKSADGNYYMAISTSTNGWIAAEDIAFCDDKTEWLSAWNFPAEKTLVVYDDKLYTEDSEYAPETANRLLTMGTCLKLAEPSDPEALIINRRAYNNHIVYLPVRGEDGSWSEVMALIGENQMVSEGFLPLTTENIMKVTMNQLGDTYGWGGMLSSEDCSGFVRDVYKCFGLELARNTTWQAAQPVYKKKLEVLNNKTTTYTEEEMQAKIEEKTEIIKQLPPGSVLIFSGHEMIYLGCDNDKLYVISSVSDVSMSSTASGPVKRVRGALINTLDIRRGSGTGYSTWLQQIHTAEIPYYTEDYQFESEEEDYSRVSGFNYNEEAFYGIEIQSGKTKYALTSAEDGTLTATEVNSENAYENIQWLLKSGTNRSGLFSVDFFELTCDPENENVLCTVPTDELKPTKGCSWNYDYADGAGTLTYTNGEAVYYVTFDPETKTFGASTDPDEAAGIILYTLGSAVGDFITKQPEAVPFYNKADNYGYQVPVYNVEADVPEGAEYTWYIDGKVAQSGSSDSLTLTAYFSYSTGVHDIYCSISYRDEYGTLFKQDTHHVNYIVCEGVLADSFITFSDVHEDFVNIGRAIGEILNENDGKIPALIVCTGDWANIHPSAEKEAVETVYLPALKAQMGGIDTVFVSGNHDNGEATNEANAEAGLGYDGNGLIYSWKAKSSDSQESSYYADGLMVYGINFDDIMITEEDGSVRYSYENVLPKLEAFFENLKDSYENEVVLISSHTGLHVLGIQPESGVEEWQGEWAYNIDKSDEMAELINKYVREYGMDVMFMFGHDHSKTENEFTLDFGDVLYSTTSYEERTYAENEILFNYGHAGYLTAEINGNQRYRFVIYDKDNIYNALKTIGSDSVDYVIPRGNTNGRKSLSLSTISGIQDKPYTGKAIKQDLVLQMGAHVLVEGKDYSVKYANNKAIGTATVTITGKGCFNGKLTQNFEIVKADNTLAVKGKTATVSYKALKNANQTLKRSACIKVSKPQGTVVYKKLSGNKKITIDKTTGKITVKKGLAKGTYEVVVKVRAKGTDVYKAASKKAVVTIVVK